VLCTDAVKNLVVLLQASHYIPAQGIQIEAMNGNVPELFQT
jgi:hypothetical protein